MRFTGGRPRRDGEAFCLQPACPGPAPVDNAAMSPLRPLLVVLALAPAAVRALPPDGIAWMWDGARMPRPAPAEIAPVVDQLLLRGTQVLERPGHPPRGLPPGVRVTPVVHVEMSVVRPPSGVDAHERLIVDAVVRAARRSTSGWVQLDLEAHPSQRAFYRRLVRDTRAALPPATRLSVTALAWWCRSNGWLDDLAADEVVPMFFRMGRDGPAMRAMLVDAPRRLHPRCRSEAAGFALQEPVPDATLPRFQRTYWFDNRHWRDTPPVSKRIAPP
jgi:hypothetical protein